MIERINDKFDIIRFSIQFHPLCYLISVMQRGDNMRLVDSDEGVRISVRKTHSIFAGMMLG